MPPRALPIKYRFEKHYDKTKDGCWNWTSATRTGYGYFGVRGRMRMAHRVSYQLYVGTIPFGMFVCHHCDNRLCVRPDHLFIGTQKDNIQDMIRKGRQASTDRTRHKGETNGRAKLTEQLVRVIRTKRGRISSKTVAAQFNVSPSLVVKIWSRDIWSHVL